MHCLAVAAQQPHQRRNGARLGGDGGLDGEVAFSEVG
jgi:hypothetical protein